MSKDVNNFGWSERFALIDRYSPDDKNICTALNVTIDELSTARELRQAGNFQSAGGMNVENYSGLFAKTITPIATVSAKVTTQKPKQTKTSATSHVKSAGVKSQQTATKLVKEPKKRGRKGTKIQEAFIAIPSSPVPVEQFAQQHGVSVPVLRQSKRFDTSGLGLVKVKKDKELNQLMIWRED